MPRFAICHPAIRALSFESAMESIAPAGQPLPAIRSLAGHRGMFMNRIFLPKGAELIFFGMVAIFASIIARGVDLGNGALVLILFPMVLIAMLMGARRSGFLASTRPVVVVQEAPERPV